MQELVSRVDVKAARVSGPPAGYGDDAGSLHAQVAAFARAAGKEGVEATLKHCTWRSTQAIRTQTHHIYVAMTPHIKRSSINMVEYKTC